MLFNVGADLFTFLESLHDIGQPCGTNNTPALNQIKYRETPYQC